MAILEEASKFTVSTGLQGVGLTLDFTILVFMLKQHKIWTLLKDRINDMYYDYCLKHDKPYSSLP